MDTTPNLRLPYIMAAQAQKHVTHNEAIRALDALVQLSVASRALDTPPVSAADGTRYIVALGASGDWAGAEERIAAWQDGAWEIYAPSAGWIAWIEDEGTAVVWNGSAWEGLGSGAGGTTGGGGSFAQVGINASADATNRLTIASTATLLSHTGGGHQLKINKAAASETGSLLFQDDWSGRAEMGLAGDDDFHVKVSVDGSSWIEALVIDRASGKVSLPATPAVGAAREPLTANRTYFVRSDGSDANSGLADNASGAFLTVQKAIDTVADRLDLNGYAVTIQLCSGSHPGGGVLRALVGGGTVTLLGDAAVPANVTVSASGTDALQGTALGGSCWRVKGLTLTTATSGNGIRADGAGRIDIDGVRFGACAGCHMLATDGGQITASGNYTVAGGATVHWQARRRGAVSTAGRTATFSGAVTFTVATAAAEALGFLDLSDMTFSGSSGVTGPRYAASGNAVIDCGGGGASYLPGSGMGSQSTGAVLL